MAGFHAFRHTFASLQIEGGTNIVRLSRLLGHDKPSFTLDVYAHMLDDGWGEPLDLDAELTAGSDQDVIDGGDVYLPAARGRPGVGTPVGTDPPQERATPDRSRSRANRATEPFRAPTGPDRSHGQGF